MHARAGTSALIAVIVGAITAGCLPLGEPPRGQQLVAGRHDNVVLFQLGAPSEPARLLTLRSSAVPGPPDEIQGQVDVFIVSNVETGHARLDLLFENADGGGISSGGPGFDTDARGRVFFTRAVQDQRVTPPEAAPLQFERFRVDPASATRTDYGVVDGIVVSSLSRDRMLVLVGQDSIFRVLDLDDHETLLPPASSAGFVGNDVYFITMDGDLFRLPGTALAATPELAAHDVATFSAVETARGDLLLLQRAPQVPTGAPTWALFDPRTSSDIPVPGTTEPFSNAPLLLPSPTGRFLLVQTFSDEGRPASATLYDRDTNTAETQADLHGEATWRPGRDEVWLQADLDAGGTAVWRWRSGEAPVHVTDGGLATSFDLSANIYTYAGEPFIEHTFPGAPFTPDGALWLSREPEGFVAIRSVDDAAFVPFALNSVGTGVSGYVPLPDGRGISEVYTTYPFHCDISLVDPRQRTSALLASTGHVVRVGAGRILALLNWVKGSLSGDLTLIDVDTGAQTLLAENVFAVAVEQPPGEIDHLPPGARVAYLVRNRIASPYDGLWVTTLP
jgi:hypothetical protein